MVAVIVIENQVKLLLVGWNRVELDCFSKFCLTLWLTEPLCT